MDMPLALVAGLGNPGAQYARTRHNAGFWFADALATLVGGAFASDKKFFGDVAAGGGVRVLKPATFMNESGRSVGAACRYFRVPPPALLVAHDEADFPPGIVKLKFGGGAAGHNGLADICQALGGAKNYWRLRLGVGSQSGDISGHVLGAPGAEEMNLIETAIVRALDLWPQMAAGRWEEAMLKLHTEKKADGN